MVNYNGLKRNLGDAVSGEGEEEEAFELKFGKILLKISVFRVKTINIHTRFTMHRQNTYTILL